MVFRVLPRLVKSQVNFIVLAGKPGDPGVTSVTINILAGLLGRAIEDIPGDLDVPAGKPIPVNIQAPVLVKGIAKSRRAITFFEGGMISFVPVAHAQVTVLIVGAGIKVKVELPGQVAA
ncbi:hypothetical protein BMS3Abin13_00821 [bacterium BMS3Abin13]|nr:hypothetical protein BMS3Abin13_00821 [bacterium BMS3Abin13]